MPTKKQQRLFNAIGIVLIIALSIGLVKFNLKLQRENEMAGNENIEDETVDIEEEKKEYDIPPIEAPKKDKTDNDIEDSNVPEYKEEIKEVDGNKVLVKPTPTPKEDEKLPEGMEKPKTEPKPTNPPKPVNTETADKKDNKTTKDKNSDKPPAYKKEEKPKVVNGGTGEDGVVRDLKGNPTGLKPATNVEEVNGSDYYEKDENGNPMVPGEGDKF